MKIETGRTLSRNETHDLSMIIKDRAKVFLESLAPVEDAMRALDFAEIEQKLEREQQQRLADRRRFGYMRDDE